MNNQDTRNNNQIITKNQIQIINWLLKFGICLYLVSCILVISSGAVEIGGYLESDYVGVVKRGGGGLIGNLRKLRFKIDSELYDNVNLHLEPEYQLLIKNEPLPLVSSVAGIDQLVWDRAYIKVNLPQADLTLGQQSIAWGTGYIWNPTDVLNPFTLSFAVSEEDEEDEIAFRFEVPLGEVDGIDGFIVGGERWQDSIKAIKRKTNVYNYDWSVSFVDLGANGFQFGFDLAGELFDLGVRNEIALISPSAANRYFKSSWGLDYTFENGWYINTEYFFNGGGQKKKENYDWTNYLDGEINQLAMDYFFFGFRKNLDELTIINLSIILNADDMSHIVYPALNYNFAENIDVSLEGLFPGGEMGSEYMPSDDEDEDGFLGSKILFTKIKYSF
jgi:hypothetical protein